MGKRKVLSEDLYGYQWISDPSVCPVTGSVAYVHTTIDKEKNNYRKHIRLITLDGNQGGQFTYGDRMSLPPGLPMFQNWLSCEQPTKVNRYGIYRYMAGKQSN